MAFWDEQNGDFVTFLKAESDITDLVGATTSARIYPDEIKQGVSMPAITYGVTLSREDRTHAGTTARRFETFEVYAFAETRSGADALAEILRVTILAQSRGTIGTAAISDLRCILPYEAGIENADDGIGQPRYFTRAVYQLVRNVTAV